MLAENLDAAKFDVDEQPARGEFKAVGRIPLLTEETLSRLQRAANMEFNVVASAVLMECREIAGGIGLQTVGMDLLGGMVAYASGGIASQDITQRIASFEERIKTAEDRSTEVSDGIKESVAQFVDGQKEGLASFKAGLSEDLKLKSATELWRDRAGWHRAATIFCFIMFAAIIAVALVLGFVHFDQIVKDLPKDSAGHIEYVSVALLAIPAIGIGWLLKVLARFVQSNSILADDSRQRQAMTRTYLSLVADKDSQVTREDRIIMLNAIFRPLPGAQSDEVAPPTVLDLLKKGGEH